MGVEVVDLEPCERCGTFAPRSEYGRRQLCGACITIVRHPLVETPRTLRGIAKTLLSLVREFGVRACGFYALTAVPMAFIAWRGEPSFLFTEPWGWFVEIVPEALIVADVNHRLLGGLAPVPLVRSRYLSLVVTAVLVSGMQWLSVPLLMLPLFPLFTFLLPATPLVLIEGLGPWKAITESFRRVRRAFWPLFALVVPSFLLGLAVSAVPEVLDSAVDATPSIQPLIAPARSVVQILQTPFDALFALLMLVAWAATRPENDHG